MNEDYVREAFNDGAAVVYTDRSIVLSKYIERKKIKYIDVLKIDTDGADLAVLKCTEAAFAKVRPLWIQIESNFARSGDGPDGAFCDVDKLLRQHEFCLVDLDVWRYARSALPSPFVYNIPAQTVDGPVAWGDAIYVDDPLSAPGKLDAWLKQDSGIERAAKLAALYEIHGLADCAAELLAALRAHPVSADRADWTAMLDLLVPENPYGAETYDDFRAAFTADPTALFPNRAEAMPETLSAEYIKISIKLDVTRRVLDRRKRRMLLMSTRMVGALAKNEHLQARLNAGERERETIAGRLETAAIEHERSSAAAVDRERTVISKYDQQHKELTVELARLRADAKSQEAALRASLEEVRREALQREKDQLEEIRKRETSLQVRLDAREAAMAAEAAKLREKAAERERTILSYAIKAWGIDAEGRIYDVFDVLAEADRKTQRLEHKREALETSLGEVQLSRDRLRTILSRPGRFAVHQWIARLLGRDPFAALH